MRGVGGGGGGLSFTRVWVGSRIEVGLKVKCNHMP